ncbi:hypothetical protein OROMI_026409 [Orobanche minor]
MNMKLPYGHASNIKNCVSMDELKMFGMKSHDCHILLQQLLPDTLLEKQGKGEFSPCGSEDVLTKALESPEHSGRVRGVGSFVTPSLFFNLPNGKGCRITKAELMARDRVRDAEMEKAKQEMTAELERTRKEMTELKAMPKLSEHASSEPKVASPSVVTGELAVDTIDNKVAFDLLFDDEEITKSLHGGVPLQPGCARVSADGPIKGDALIPIPIVGQIETVDQAVGSHVSWPRELIIVQNTPLAANQGEKKRNIRMSCRKYSPRLRTEINKNVPQRFRLLYKHATTFMKSTGNSIQIPCDPEFKMIGQAAISSYMAVVRENDNLDLFAFCDPGAAFNLNSHFETYLINRFNEGDPDRLFLLPVNQHYHWILVLIWGGKIYFLNPLPRSTGYSDVEKAISRALIAYNIEAGRGNKAPGVKYIPGCPKQPGGIECGYVVMRYMKEIAMYSEMSSLKKNRKAICSRAELDEVRFETPSHIESFL